MADKEEEKIKKKRSVMRSLTTKLISKIEALLLNENVENILTELEELQDNLIEKETELKQLDAQIENFTDIEEIENEIIVSQEYREKIISYKRRINRKINVNLKTETNSNIESANSSVSIVGNNVENSPNDDNAENITNNSTEIRRQISTDRNTSNNANVVKLPKLSISKFFGDPSRWLEFWHQFESAIDKNCSLCEVDKFNYLKSYLGGTALTAVSGFALTNDNYKAALDVLKSRYGRRDIVINSLMCKLLNLEPLKNPSNVKEFRKLYDECETQIRSLESFGVTSGTYGNLLCPILLKLIPNEISLEFNRQRKNKEEIVISELMEFLKVEIEYRETTSLLHNPKPDEKFFAPKTDYIRSKFNGAHNRNYKPTASSFATNTLKPFCIFCNDSSHDSKICKATSVETKLNKLKSEQRCFRCFKRFHTSSQCRIKQNACQKCNSNRHSEVICTKSETLKPEISSNIAQSDTVLTSISESVSHCNDNSKNALLQTCTVLACSEIKTKIAKVLLDNASTKSFITKECANRLNAKIIRKERLSVFSFGSRTAYERNYEVVNIKLRNRIIPENYIDLEVLVTDVISAAPLLTPNYKIVTDLCNRNIQLADEFETNHESDIEILIGADRFWDVVKNGNIEKLNKTLYLVPTIFGMTLQGYQNYMKGANVNNVIVNLNMGVSEESLNELPNLWKLDVLGICEDGNTLSLANQEIIDKFEKQLEFKDGRYFTSLLWNNDVESKLENNFNNAKRQFDNLKIRLNKNKWVCDQYKELIDEQKSLGIVEECQRTSDEYFAPHREVVRHDKQTTRVRMVYNCSSKVGKNKSLNECLQTGPPLSPSVLDIILRFRMFTVAFSGDLEKAFLMIGIKEPDRNYLKFLWFGDNEENYKVMRLNRVPFGCNCSSFILSATIKKHLKGYKSENPDCVAMLDSALYVDDLIFSSNCDEKAFELTRDAVEILKNCGMNLRKFNTNSKGLEELWDNSCYFDGAKNDEKLIKVLGICWNKNEDTLSLELKSLVDSLSCQSSTANTKRYVLHTAARIFDPLGIVSPFLIRIKGLLQRIWEKGIHWDDELPTDLKVEWQKWCLEVKTLMELKIDRHYFLGIDFENMEIELHIFSDASPVAYGCVAYFRFLNQVGKCFVSMVMSKARVAPLKKLSLPRLELMGAVLAARLGKYLRDTFKEIQFENFYWSDSSIVLHWLKSSSKIWKPFVQNRVAEIQSLCDPQGWSYCNTKDNSADLVTRGISAANLINSDLWFKGPSWLSKSKEFWPRIITKIDDENVSVERKPQPHSAFISSLTKASEPIFNLENYNSLNKVLRITAYVQRFIENCKKSNVKENGSLTSTELNLAEEYWVKYSQKEHFYTVISQIENGKLQKDSVLAQYNPFINDKGILCSNRRLQFATCSETEKYPWILQPRSKFSELVVMNSHRAVLHSGLCSTLTQVREKYFILRGRQYVKSLLRNCLTCKRYKATGAQQVVAPLPKERIDVAPPFSMIGLDFAGPLHVKDSECKHYILLITCAITRAVHLELVPDLTTDTFLLAFRRFISRRGVPNTIYSDNAKTFKKANLELSKMHKIVTHEKVKEYCAFKRMNWKYIVERAPWWGGFWERMVKSVKSVLRKVLGRSCLTRDELETLLIEVEATINNRPITYIYDTPMEPSPITPAHFLIGQRISSLPHTQLNLCSSNKSETIKRYNLRKTLSEHLWRRWQKEYLLNLKTYKPKGNVVEFKENDVVLLREEKLPRNMWRMGVITKVFPGRDNKIRACEIKLAPDKIIKRPVQLLHQLELENCT